MSRSKDPKGGRGNKDLAGEVSFSNALIKNQADQGAVKDSKGNEVMGSTHYRSDARATKKIDGWNGKD